MLFDDLEETLLLDARFQRVAHVVVDVVHAAQHAQRLSLDLPA
jgi:hypothetical protein